MLVYNVLLYQFIYDNDYDNMYIMIIAFVYNVL